MRSDSLRIAPLPTPRTFQTDSTRYILEAWITSEERVPTITRDSSRYAEELRVRLIALSDSLVKLTLHSDSGYRRLTGSDRAASVTTRQDTFPQTRMEFDLNPVTRSWVESTTASSCGGSSSFLTPLLAHLLGRSILPDTLSEPHTVSYRTCTSGVTTSFQLEIARASGSGVPYSVSDRLSVVGTAQADSSHFLPMHLAGVVRGVARISKGHASFPDTMDIRLTSQLHFESSLRKQLVHQETRLLLHRLP